MTQELQIKKSALYKFATIILLIAIIISAVYFNSNKNKPLEGNLEERQAEITAYKIAMYESILCQHNCPLVTINFEGQTGMIPEQACVNLCIEDIKTVYDPDNLDFSPEELTYDNLIRDIEGILFGCRENSEIELGLSVEKSQELYGCTSAALDKLKELYPYLND